MKGIIDRIEDGIVTLELGTNYFNLSLDKFPKQIKEGDIVEYKDNKFIILVEETISRKKEIKNLFDSLLIKDE